MTVAVREETWLTRVPIAWMAWASCSSGVDIVIGDGVNVGLDEGMEILENCGDVEHSQKMLNNSSWGQVHDPVLSLSQGESVKENPKSDLLNQAVR